MNDNQNKKNVRRTICFDIESRPDNSTNGTNIKETQKSKTSILYTWINDKHVEEFCENFTVHALPFAFKINTSPIRRFIWFILFLTSFALSFVFIWNILVEFLQKDYATSSIKIALDAKQGMPFPSITIWNESPVKSSLLLNNNSNYSKYANDLCSLRSEVHGGGVHGGPVPPDWNEDLAMELGINMKDMLIDCEFNGIQCSHENFTLAFTPYPYYRWGIGYTFNHQSNLKTNGTGPDHGLRLVLNIQYSEYCPSTLSTGIRVQLHDHTDLEDDVALEHIDPSLGDTVEPGKYTSIAVKRKEFKSIGKPYSSDCIDLRNGDAYPSLNRTVDCVYACEDRGFNEITPYNLLNTQDQCVIDCFGARSTQFCHAVEFEVRKSVASISSLNFDKIEELTEEVVTELYKDKSIYAPFLPSDLDNLTSLSELKENLDKEIRSNIVVVDIYYDKLVYEKTREIPSLTAWRMLGDIGGVLGLFLGASIITGFEFVEILFLMFLRCSEICSDASRKETYFKKYFMSKQEREDRSQNLDDEDRIKRNANLYLPPERQVIV